MRWIREQRNGSALGHAKNGKSRSQEDIKKSLKQVVVAPSNLGDMKDQLRIYICVLSILFGKQSLLPRDVTRFHNALIDYSSELKCKLDCDKFLAAKMLLAMDQDIQRWLKECKRFKEREDVSGMTSLGTYAAEDSSLTSLLFSIATQCQKMSLRAFLTKEGRLKTTHP